VTQPGDRQGREPESRRHHPDGLEFGHCGHLRGDGRSSTKQTLNVRDGHRRALLANPVHRVVSLAPIS
jgi:hypothetical protein